MTSKYTYDDIDWLRVLCEGYDEDSEMSNICKKALKALRTGNYNIRFTQYQKEILSQQYENKQYLTAGELNVLHKIIGY